MKEEAKEGKDNRAKEEQEEGRDGRTGWQLHVDTFNLPREIQDAGGSAVGALRN